MTGIVAFRAVALTGGSVTGGSVAGVAVAFTFSGNVGAVAFTFPGKFAVTFAGAGDGIAPTVSAGLVIFATAGIIG